MASDKDLCINVIGQNDEFLKYFLDKSNLSYSYTLNEACNDRVNVFLHNSSISRVYDTSGAKLNIYVSLEPYEYLNKIHPKFLEQFDLCIVSDANVSGSNIVKMPNYLPWLYFNVTKLNGKHKIDFRQPTELTQQPTSNRFLTIISNKQTFPGHEKRLNIVERLKDSKHADQIDFYGFGLKDFANKFDLMTQYKNSIVLENSQQYHYVSEKLTDSMLCGHRILYLGSQDRTITKTYGEIMEFKEPWIASFDKFVEYCNAHSEFNCLKQKNIGENAVFKELNIFHKIPRLIEAFGQHRTQDKILPNFYFGDITFNGFIKKIGNYIFK